LGPYVIRMYICMCLMNRDDRLCDIMSFTIKLDKLRLYGFLIVYFGSLPFNGRCLYDNMQSLYWYTRNQVQTL